MELHYTLWNQTDTNSSPPKITLLHGMGGTGALWRPIAASLENEMQCLSLDQRGHGKSQIPHMSGGRIETNYTPLDYGKDVIDTWEFLAFYPSWIIGHSMGVRSAVAAAYLKPDWVEGLILIDLGLSGVAGGGLGENLAHFLKILPHHFPSREDARNFMAANCPDPAIGQYLMAVSVRDALGHVSFPFDHAALIQTIYAARDVSVRNWLLAFAHSKKPILILRGERSLVWKSEEFENERKVFQSFPHVNFKVIPNAGHGLPFEQRPVFVQMVRDFISASSKPNSTESGSGERQR
jgi:pimeloyl-ACP methyl ester carboxylesterase